jgi:hypothetical protein
MKTNFLPQLQMDLYGAMGDDGDSLPMKLYTEKQINWAICIICQRNQVLEQLTPIELPSDEEIEKEVEEYVVANNKMNFINGAKWMKEQIINQNK